jgi:hypothetical protein
VPKWVAGDLFGESHLSDRLRDRLCDKRLVNLAPSLLAGATRSVRRPNAEGKFLSKKLKNYSGEHPKPAELHD